MNRKWLSLLTGALLVTLACGLGSASTPAPPAVETVVAATLQARTANPTTAQAGIPVSFQNVAWVIPSGLANGAKSELVPAATDANSDPWSVAPEHISFTLTSYSLTEGSIEAVVRVYPASEYAAVNGWAQSSLTRLRTILASPAMPLTNNVLSTVPFYGDAAQQYAAQPRLLPFNGGTGVRMLSQYGQGPGPITKDNSFYHYEGLTSDGKYLVAVVLPVSLPLKATASNPSADGIPFPTDIANTAGLTSYYQAVSDLLNAAAPESFQPSLTQLDALIKSITVRPK